MTINLTPELETQLHERPILSEMMQGYIGLFDSQTSGIAEQSSALYADGLTEEYRRQGLTL
jgi:hypothetical protein